MFFQVEQSASVVQAAVKGKAARADVEKKIEVVEKKTREAIGIDMASLHKAAYNEYANQMKEAAMDPTDDEVYAEKVQICTHNAGLELTLIQTLTSTPA